MQDVAQNDVTCKKENTLHPYVVLTIGFSYGLFYNQDTFSLRASM